MPRRPRGTQSHAAAPDSPTTPATNEPKGRSDQLVDLIDHLTAAKQTSDAVGEKFLSYLLSMAIQETRMAMRGQAIASTQ